MPLIYWLIDLQSDLSGVPSIYPEEVVAETMTYFHAKCLVPYQPRDTSKQRPRPLGQHSPSNSRFIPPRSKPTKMSYYFTILSPTDTPIFNIAFGTSKGGGDGIARFRFPDTAQYMNQFIIHSSLDIVEEAQWTNGGMYVPLISDSTKGSMLPTLLYQSFRIAFYLKTSS